MRRASTYQFLSGFFGLTYKNRGLIFSQIHEIVFHGNGGYTWTDIYNMPIWLRRFTFEKIQEFYDKRNSSGDTESNDNNTQPKGPDIKPSYSTKASKI